MKLTGKVLEGNYIGAAWVSGKPIDRPTNRREVFHFPEGCEGVRTVYERVIWRNMKPCKPVAKFVIFQNRFWEVD